MTTTPNPLLPQARCATAGELHDAVATADNLARLRRNRLATAAAQAVANGVTLAHGGWGLAHASAAITQTSIGGVVQYSDPRAIEQDYAAALAENIDRMHNRWEQDAYDHLMSLGVKSAWGFAWGYLSEAIRSGCDRDYIAAQQRGLQRALNDLRA